MNKLLTVMLMLLMSLESHAFSSIATVDGYVGQTFQVAWDYSSQKEADRASIEGCRDLVKKNGLPEKLIKSCTVKTRGKNSGYGAATCGENGCTWITGASDAQAAVDSVYASCSKSYKGCNSENITNWHDTKGFMTTKIGAIDQRANCIPNTAVRRCTSRCVNGSCEVTYENGCKVNVQVSPEWNTMTNQWDFRTPQC